jgi:DNA-binding beta-propeller fold protein YncE
MPMISLRTLQRLLLLLTVSLLFAGCVGRTAPVSGIPSELLRWPPAPAPVKIQWLGEFNDPRDLDIRKGFWTRVVEFVSGEERTGIVRPYGVFADDHGRIYVADPGGGVVHLLDRENHRSVRLMGGDDAPLRLPIGVTGDGNGTVYVTDSASGVVFRHVVGEEILTPFINGTVLRPTGIVCDPVRKRIYVSDTSRHQIAVFDLAGKELFRIGSRGSQPAEFNFPTDLCLDRQGQLVVTDSLNSRIQVISPDGHFVSQLGKAGDSAGYLSKPKGVAVDSEGHIYSADALHDAVQIFDVSGRLLLSFGMRGTRPAEFWMPSGLFMDSHDTLFVSDTFNHRIQLFRYRRDAGNPP